MKNPALLRWLKKHKACRAAQEWVRGQHDQRIGVLWHKCPDFAWMLWLMYRLNRKRYVQLLVPANIWLEVPDSQREWLRTAVPGRVIAKDWRNR